MARPRLTAVDNTERAPAPASATSHAFYSGALEILCGSGIPFLIAGTYALNAYTGLRRRTKDIDVFCKPGDYPRILHLFQEAGCEPVIEDERWIAKVRKGEDFFDIIFNSTAGVTPVNDQWFVEEREAEIFGHKVRILPPTEFVWSKAFVQNRERYDGADIAHLLQANAERIDWPRLVERFGAHWRVLLAHLSLFGFIYPGERHRIPQWVMQDLLDKMAAEIAQPPAHDPHVCAGTLLSREQYLHDVERLGYIDGRLTPVSTMTPEDVATWTDAIPARQAEAQPDTAVDEEGQDAPVPRRAAGWSDSGTLNA